MYIGFGDKDGREYQSRSIRNEVDHINMDHKDNSVFNLQLVSHGVNLFRAYYKTGDKNCKDRFSKYYDSLDSIDKKILDIEIKLDIEGRY